MQTAEYMNELNLPHRWPKGVSGNPKGRPSKSLLAVQRSCPEGTDLDLDQIFTVYRTVLDMPFEEVKRLADKDTEGVPALLKAACRFVEHDIAKGYGDGVEKLLNRMYGRKNDNEQATVQNSIINIQVINNDHETAQDVSEVIQGIQATRHPNDNRGGGLEIGQDVQHNDVSTSNGTGAGAAR